MRIIIIIIIIIHVVSWVSAEVHMKINDKRNRRSKSRDSVPFRSCTVQQYLTIFFLRFTVGGEYYLVTLYLTKILSGDVQREVNISWHCTFTKIHFADIYNMRSISCDTVPLQRYSLHIFTIWGQYLVTLCLYKDTYCRYLQYKVNISLTLKF